MNTWRSLVRSSGGRGALVAAAAFGVYLMTLAPGVDFIDAGELSAVAWTLGIAHPTGYPLFSVVGWCFAHVPLPVEPVVRLNIMAAVLGSAGVFMFFQLVAFILREVFPSEDGQQERLRLAATTGASLLLAFSETYWSQAVAVEVYSLHLFLVSIVLYSFLSANGSTRQAMMERMDRWWIAFAFTLGLAFANHMTTILLAPGFLVYYFWQQGWNARSWRRIGLLVLPFLLGISVYLYLPIRGGEDPVMNWGAPTTLERFLWHVSGKQFRVWIFSSTSVAGKQFTYFLSSLPSEHGYVGLLLAIPGMILLWFRSKLIAVLTALLAIVCVGYSINYDIHDIDSYFLLSYLMVALWAGVTLFSAGQWLMGRHASVHGLIIVSIMAIGLIPLAVHYPTADESRDFLVEDYTANMFSSLDSGAIALSTQWDFWVSAAYYEQLVRRVRADVTVIDKELLRRSWYLHQLEHRFPQLIERSRPEMNAYLAELYKYEHDLPYESAVIERRYADLIMSFISRNLTDHPVYVTSDIEQQYTGGLRRIPEGLALRLYADTVFHPSRFPDFKFRPFDRHGRLEDATRRLYSNAYLFRAQYYGVHGDLAEAEKSLKKALFFDPTHPTALQWLKAISGRRQ